MHKLARLEVVDGIISRIAKVACSCGWSGGTFVADDENLKTVEKSLRKRFAAHSKKTP